MRKSISLLPVLLFVISAGKSFAQPAPDDRQQLLRIIECYRQSVIDKDSTTFYSLFNVGPVIWLGALKPRSQAREVERKGIQKAGSNYFQGSYQGFFRALYQLTAPEDKFDNIHINEDGAVASITMDYSFWANHQMTNWGGKYLQLIKRDGDWKITSVIYSLDLTSYFAQPSLRQRRKMPLKK